MDMRKEYRRHIKRIYKEFEPEIKEYGFASVTTLIALRKSGVLKEQIEQRAARKRR